MMAYLYAYLAMGSVVCVAVLVSHLRADSTRLYKRSAFLDALHPERKTRRYRILTQQVAPVLTGIALVLVWPIGVFMKVKDLAERRAQAKREKASVFTVKRRDLQQRMSAAEIELLEFVQDPLGATPNLPFGHAHTAWKKFLEKLAPSDELWRFSSEWTPPWGPKEHRCGYAISRNKKITAYFMTSRQRQQTSSH